MAFVPQSPADVEQFRKELLAAAKVEREKAVHPYHAQQRFPQKENADLAMARQLTRQQMGQAQVPYEQFIGNIQRQGQKLTKPEITEYMNPYLQNVINKIAREGHRTFTEKIQPSLEGKFARLGQHGSLHHRKESQKFARDISQDISERQQEALHRGYLQALETAKGEKERGLESSRLSSIVNSMKQAAMKGEIEDLMALGMTKEQAEQMKLDYDYQEFLRQDAARSEKLAQASAILHGLPYSAAQIAYPQTQLAQNIAAQQQRHLNPFGQIMNIATQLLGAGRAAGRI